MEKLTIGDKCRVVKNAFAPDCTGQTVEIVDIVSVRKNRVLYKIKENVDGLELFGYASEKALEKIW